MRDNAAEVGILAIKFQFHVLEDEMLHKIFKSKRNDALFIDDLLQIIKKVKNTIELT